MKFECVSSSKSGFKKGEIYTGELVNDDNFIVIDDHLNSVNIARRNEGYQIFLPVGEKTECILHQIVDGIKFRDAAEAIVKLHSKDVKFMKFECISDNTKKFTVGKVYEVPTEHYNNTIALTDDTGRRRIAKLTHNGEGIRWNSGGTKFATFGKKRKRTFCVNGNVAANKIHNVKPSEVDCKPSLKFEEKADLSGLGIALVLLVAAISLMFIM